MQSIQRLRVKNANGTFEQVVPIGSISTYVTRPNSTKSVEDSLLALEQKAGLASYGLERTTPATQSKVCQVDNLNIKFTHHADLGILNVQIPPTVLISNLSTELSFDLSDIIFIGPDTTVKKKVALPKNNQWCVVEVNDTTVTLHSFNEMSLVGEEFYLDEFIQL